MTGGAAVRHWLGMAKELSGWQPAFFLLVVIPAQAGIQWFRQVIPAKAGMTTLQAHISRNPYSETRVISMASIMACTWPATLEFHLPTTIASALPGSRSEVSLSVSYRRSPSLRLT